MEIKYRVTEEDYIKFNIYHAENSKAHKKSYYTLKYLLSLICGLAIYFIGSNLFNQPKLYWGIIAIVFVLAWIIRFPKTYEKIIRKSVESMLKDKDNSSMLCENTMIIGEDEIRVINKHTTEIISKEGIKEVKVYDDMILIYLSDFAAHIIPTRYLTDETKEKLLKELAFAMEKQE